MAWKYPTRLRYACSVVTVVVIAVGCTTERQIPSAEPSPKVESDECINQADDTLKLRDVTTQADLDGDGSKEGVGIVINEDAEIGCQAFLVGSIGEDIVSEPVWRLGAQGGLDEPRISGLVQIDGTGGTEVLVSEIAGASTEFIGAFTYTDGTLERIRGKGDRDLWSGAADGVFPSGGSVGHLEAVDCSEGGRIVISVALPSGASADTYEMKRRFFTLEGSQLTIDDELTEKHKLRSTKIDDFPEFAGSPFGSCG